MNEQNQRMTTGIERVFRAIPMRSDLYQEVLLHWIYFLDPNTGETTRMKLDKQILGGIWKLAVGSERSLYGETVYKFPDGVERRLVAVRENVAF